MKKRALWFTVLLAAAISAFGDGDKKDLMARMGFSKEEIAKDVSAHKATTGILGTGAGKSDPKEAALVLREANEVNKLRELSAVRQQAESFAAAAEKEAFLAKAKQKGAEEKAESARRGIRRMALGFSNTWTYANALDDRDTLERNAQEAREVADEETRNAEQARVAANAIIAKAYAAERKLEEERLARVVAIRDRPPQR